MIGLRLLSLIGLRLLSRPGAIVVLLVLGLCGWTALGIAAAGDPPLNTAAPTVSGLARQGETVTASLGSWTGGEPMSAAYQWRRCEAGYAGAIAAAGPIGYWRLGESSGSTAADGSGQHHHGRYNGSYLLAEPDALAVDGNPAVRLGAASPAGSITVAHRGTLNYRDAVTYEAWVRLLRLPAAGSVGANIATKDGGTLVLRILPSGVLSLRKSGGNELTQSTAALSADGRYHHVVAVKAGTATHVYVDGVDVTGPVVNQALANSTAPLTVAGSAPSQNRDGIEGYLDEFALYNRGLSAAEVVEHYAIGREGVCANIEGATADSHAVGAGDVGKALEVAVTATNSAGSATAVSEPTGLVAAADPPENTEPPAVTGLAREGETLTASRGGWTGTEPISYGYEWRRCEAGYAGLVSAAGPIGFWRLGERSGTTAADTSERGHDGGYSGNYVLGEPDALAVDADPAVRVSPASPAGAITVPHRSTLNYGDAVTYEAWVRLLSLPAASSVGANIATKNTGTLVLRILPSGVISLRKSAGNELTQSTVALSADGRYHHVVAVKAGTAVRVYLDGADVTGPVTNQTLVNNGSEPLTIAGSMPSQNRDGIEGYLDEFALYNRAVTAAQVDEHYAAGREGVCTALAGATGETYELTTADVGAIVRVAVTATNLAGSAAAESEPTDLIAVAAYPPVATEPPTITGTAREGETLNATPGSWTGTDPITHAYQWRRCDAAGAACTDIDGATDNTYVLTFDDVYTTIRIAVTATNSDGSATAESEPTGLVARADPPANTAPPTVTGLAREGETLIASPGSWTGTEPISYGYQWRRCEAGYADLIAAAAPIGYWRLGERSGTTAADASGRGHDGGYSGNYVLAEPDALAVDANPAVRTSSVSPAGAITVPHRSTLNYGDAVTYEAWVRLLSLPAAGSVGANIATKNTGTLVLRILPSGVLSLRKSAGNELTQSTAALSADGGYHHVVAVKAGSAVRVYIDGADVTGPVTNQTLANGTEPLTIAGSMPSQNRDGIEGYLDEFALYNRALTAAQVADHYAAGREGVCTPIAGATAEAQELTAADVGATVRVAVTASNVSGSVTAESEPSELVAPAPDAPVATDPPAITGTAREGERLTASPGGWTGAEPITHAYQWRRCDAGGNACTNIDGATDNNYLLTLDDVDTTIRIAVTAGNSGGSATAVSAATARVEAAPVGFIGPSFAGVGDTSPTGSKPQSKLWWNDGFWWASMWATASGSYHIFRLELDTQTWVDTGTEIDGRPGTRADALWDGTHLYLASHVFATCGCSTPQFGNPSRLYRYSYDTVEDRYVLDTGFPVPINDTRSETLVIDKDSTGALWATWAQDNRVYVNRTFGDDRIWGLPFVLPAAEAENLEPDDISTLGAFGGDSIGVMWSNQSRSAMYFAVHLDGDPPVLWQATEVALGGNEYADDHLNLDTDTGGRVLAVMKTSRGDVTNPDPADPQLMVLTRDPVSGAWASYRAGRVSDDHTRPILLVDEESRRIHVFATAPTPGGAVYHKASSLDEISFGEGLGTPFMRGGSSTVLNNATSTKQNVDETTGLVVAASEGTNSNYWHNYLPLGG